MSFLMVLSLFQFPIVVCIFFSLSAVLKMYVSWCTNCQMSMMCTNDVIFNLMLHAKCDKFVKLHKFVEVQAQRSLS